jgi:acyl-CoA dehydrogenase
MVSFALSPQQRTLQETARRFAQTEILPIAAHHDQTGEFPWELMRKAFDAGLMNDAVPPEYGGRGLSCLESVLLAEELAAGCAGIATSLLNSDLAATPIVLAGTDEQKSRFLGQLTAKLSFAAFCLTEPQSGSDAAGLVTSCRRQGDAYVLSGEKCFITNGSVASVYVVFATQDPAQRARGISAFIVPRDTPGISIGRIEDKMGQRASNTASVIFDNVRVPAAQRLGEEGDGFKIAMRTLDRARPSVAGIAVGIARSALEHAIRHAKQRCTFGQPIAQHQGIQFMLAEMARDVEAARMVAWQAAWRIDQKEDASKESAIAKLLATDTAMKVTTDAVQIFGGYGYMKDHPVEKLMRDAKLTQIYEGTNQIQRLVIARKILEDAAD